MAVHTFTKYSAGYLNRKSSTHVKGFFFNIYLNTIEQYAANVCVIFQFCIARYILHTLTHTNTNLHKYRAELLVLTLYVRRALATAGNLLQPAVRARPGPSSLLLNFWAMCVRASAYMFPHATHFRENECIYLRSICGAVPCSITKLVHAYQLMPHACRIIYNV